MSRARLAERLWSASQADPVLQRQLREEWRGPGDARDALWWHAHPLADTPHGTPDAAVALRALQAAVYSRAGATGGTAGDEERLSALMLERTERETALNQLLDRFADESGAPDSPQDAGAASIPGSRAVPGPAQDPPVPGRPLRHPLLLVCVGLLLGIVGTTAVRAMQSPEQPGDTPVAATATPAPARELPPAAPGLELPEPTGVFQVFARPPLFIDGAPALWSNVVLDSVREVDSFYSFQAYVGRNTDGEYCGLIRQSGRFGGGVACATEATLRRHGLTMGAILPAKDGDPDYPDYIDVRFTWSPDGSFQIDKAAADHP